MTEPPVCPGAAAAAPRDEADLEERLSRPAPRLVAQMRALAGDLIILGIGGKMGVSLGRLAVRALRAAGRAARVIGVSRFSSPEARSALEADGIETLACDLADPDAVARLPPVNNVLFLAGRKFGTVGDEAGTWVANTVVPGHVARHFAGGRIVAFSTGCVYPLVPPAAGGCREDTPPAPVGEYALSCLGRERVFEHFSRQAGTPVCLFRLNYAADLRYGVLHDLATAILAGAPVSLNVPAFNVIWQGDANHRALYALDLCASPPAVLNVTGPEQLRTRTVAERIGALFARPVSWAGPEGETAYLNDASRSLALFGPPAVSAAELIAWQAAWLAAGNRGLGKPTHFAVSNGVF
jgi:nucleoside-diphosphate-sugar epimerase